MCMCERERDVFTSTLSLASLPVPYFLYFSRKREDFVLPVPISYWAGYSLFCACLIKVRWWDRQLCLKSLRDSQRTQHATIIKTNYIIVRGSSWKVAGVSVHISEYIDRFKQKSQVRNIAKNRLVGVASFCMDRRTGGNDDACRLCFLCEYAEEL